MKAVLLLVDDRSAEPGDHLPYRNHVVEAPVDAPFKGDFFAAVWLRDDWTKRPDQLVAHGARLMELARERFASAEANAVRASKKQHKGK